MLGVKRVGWAVMCSNEIIAEQVIGDEQAESELELAREEAERALDVAVDERVALRSELDVSEAATVDLRSTCVCEWSSLCVGRLVWGVFVRCCFGSSC